MKVLHINKFHYLRGGAEVVYFNTAHLLKINGHQSVFFSMHHPQNLPCKTSKYFMPFVDLNTHGNGVLSQLKTAGRIMYSFEARKLLSRLLDEYDVDIAHLHNIWHHISPSILYELKKRKIPVVMTLHDYKMACASYHLQASGKPCEACRGRKYYMAVKKRCVKGSFVKSILCTLEMYLHHKILDIYDNVDVFISPSRFLKDKLLEMGFRKEIVHIPNYVDIEKFNCYGRDDDLNCEIDERKNSVVYFGRLSPEKGLRTLMKAAKLLSRESMDNRNQKTEITVIGEGPMKEELQEDAKREGICNVRFLGYMKGERLYNEVKKGIAAILPSEWYENNPMSIIEAFALGKPVIGSRMGGIPELVVDNETGLTFEAGNAEDLSKKIKALLADTSSAYKMGKNARKFVENKLNQENHYKKLMGIYRHIL